MTVLTDRGACVFNKLTLYLFGVRGALWSVGARADASISTSKRRIFHIHHTLAEKPRSVFQQSISLFRHSPPHSSFNKYKRRMSIDLGTKVISHKEYNPGKRLPGSLAVQMWIQYNQKTKSGFLKIQLWFESVWPTGRIPYKGTSFSVFVENNLICLF